MSEQMGSPRGIIRIHPQYNDKDEYEKEKYQSLEQEIESIQRSQKIAKQLLTAKTDKFLHPFVDLCPKDDTPHLFLLYQKKEGETLYPGYFILTIDNHRLANRNPNFKYHGTAKEFIHQAIGSIPELSHVYICEKDMIPKNIYNILAKECPKIGIKLVDTVYSKEETPQEKVENTKKHKSEGLTLQERSQLQDPYHKLRGQHVASIKKRLIRIALYVARTPIDEKEEDDEEWAIFPDEPTKAGEPDTLAKFPTRDEAVKAMKEMQKKKKNISKEKGIKPEDIKIEEVTISSENKQANVTSDWMTPEEIVETAWSLREEAKIKKEKNNDI